MAVKKPVNASSSPSVNLSQHSFSSSQAGLQAFLPTRLGALLPQLSTQLCLTEKTAQWSVTRLWPTVLEQLQLLQFLPPATQAIHTTGSLHAAVLLVQTRSVAQMALLQLHAPRLCQALNAYSAQTGVTLRQIQYRA